MPVNMDLDGLRATTFSSVQRLGLTSKCECRSPVRAGIPAISRRMEAKLPTLERERAVEDLEHAASLLHLSERTHLAHQNAVWINSARNDILTALRLLLELPALPQTCTSVCELILKAELALASVDLVAADHLSVRVADGLLVQARARIEGFASRKSGPVP